METEPTRVITLLTAAVTITFNFLGLILSWSNDVIVGANLVAGAWIALAGEIIRRRVTPTANVALTKQDVIDLIDAGYQPGNQIP